MRRARTPASTDAPVVRCDTDENTPSLENDVMKSAPTKDQAQSLRSLAFLAFMALTLSACGGDAVDDAAQVDAVDDDIIGGTVAAVGSLPWQAQIKVPGFSHYCGGSLIARDWVLTAAHCVEFNPGQKNWRPVSDFTVVLGEHDWNVVDGAEQSRAVVQVIPHPTYPDNTAVGHKDFALMKLASPVDFNSRVQPIRPAIGGDGSGQNAVVSGWGSMGGGGPSTNILRNVTLPIVANSACNAAPLTRDLFADEICAGFLNGSKGSCHGDSGGPMTVERSPGFRELVGVVSWGGGSGCPTYGVYGRIASDVNWIRKYVMDPAWWPVLAG